MKQFFILMLSLVTAFTALASDQYSSKQYSSKNSAPQNDDNIYLGLKGGRMLVAFDDTSGAVSTGFVVGYEFDERFSLEGSYIKGSPIYETGAPRLKDINGSGEDNIDYSNHTRNKLSTNVYGLYLNYRSQGEWYLLAKGGIAKADMKSNAFVPGIDNIAFSGSLGGGWRVGKSTLLEAEVTHIDKNLTYIGITGIVLGF